MLNQNKNLNLNLIDIHEKIPIDRSIGSFHRMVRKHSLLSSAQNFSKSNFLIKVHTNQ